MQAIVRKEAIKKQEPRRLREFYIMRPRSIRIRMKAVSYLENMLKTATIVSDDSKTMKLEMDDIVEVYFEEDDEIEKYKLVTSIRGNSMENRISIEFPLVRALKGHKLEAE